MNALVAIIKKELKSVTKEKTIMIAVGIQLFLASFSSAILIGMLSFYDPDSIGLNARISIRAGIIGDINSSLLGFLSDQNVRVTALSSPEEAERAFRAGAVDTIIFIPETGPENSAPVVTAPVIDIKLFLPESETQSTLILMILKEPMKQYENYLRERQGVHVRYTDIEGLPSTTYEFRYSVIIPILMLFPAFVAGSMVVDSISEELENHTLDTLWSAPLSLNVIFGAKIVAALVLAVVQCALWTLLLRFNGTVIHNLGLVLLLAALLAAVIAVGSAFVSVYFKDRERSQFVYSLFTLLSAGLGYFFDASPITLMTRLAAGDYYTGIADVAMYGVLLLALLAAFFSLAERLIAVPS